MQIDPVNCLNEAGGNGGGGGVIGGGNGIQVGGIGGPNQIVMAQNNVLRVQLMEVLNTLRTQHKSLKLDFSQLKRTVGRFANRPAQTLGGFFAPK
jgi:hypothetical protein